jgi:hypothetical protein
MLFREIIAVYCENHTEHINTLCGQTAEFRNVKPDGTNSYQCPGKGHDIREDYDGLRSSSGRNTGNPSTVGPTAANILAETAEGSVHVRPVLVRHG